MRLVVAAVVVVVVVVVVLVLVTRTRAGAGRGAWKRKTKMAAMGAGVVAMAAGGAWWGVRNGDVESAPEKVERLTRMVRSTPSASPTTTTTTTTTPTASTWTRHPKCDTPKKAALLNRYAEMHRRVTSSRNFPEAMYDPARLNNNNNNNATDQVLVYVGFPPPAFTGRQTGLADRLTGLVTLFAVCVATDTVFLVDWPHLQTAVETNPLLAPLFANVSRVSREFRSPIFRDMEARDARESKSLPFYLRYAAQKGTLSDAVVRLLDRAAGRQHGNVYFAREAHGGMFRLLSTSGKQPGARAFTEKMFVEAGFTHDDLYGCLLRELFRGPNLDPTSAPTSTLDLYARLGQVKRRPIISLQIRTGDGTIKQRARNQDVSVVTDANSVRVPNRFLNFFRCAEHIERTHLKGASRAQDEKNEAVWYLATDNEALRSWAALAYPTRVLTATSHVVHTGWPAFANDAKGFAEAFAEFWAVSLGDYFVISRTSGLGMQAALLSLQPRGRTYRLAALPEGGIPSDAGGGIDDLVRRVGVFANDSVPLPFDTAVIVRDCEPFQVQPERLVTRYSEIRL